jgi:hypothetical protein
LHPALNFSLLLLCLVRASAARRTLARLYADHPTDTTITRFDLEDPTDLAALAEPKPALQGLTGLVIIDEVQRVPALFPVLRVLVDRPGNPARGSWGELCGAPDPWDRRVALGVGRVVAGMAECNSAIPEG